MRKLTSELQSTIFKSEDESHLIDFVRKIDCNKDDEITQEDLVVFKESIRPHRNYKPAITNKIYLEELLNKMREKSIKKKISFYDFFNKLDSKKDGFITLDEWNTNLDQILPLSEEEK